MRAYDYISETSRLMWDWKIRRKGAKDARIRKEKGQKSLWPLCLCGSILLFAAACGDAPIPPLTATPTRALSGPTLEPSPTTDVHPPTQDILEDNILGGPGQNIPEAADIAANSALPPVIQGTPGAFSGSQRVQLTMPDGAALMGDIYQAATTDNGNGTPQPPLRMPGVLLLGASIAEWGDFPARVRDAGYTVLVMELRDSSGVADFTTMLRGLSGANTVNPGLMAVIGAGQGADLALIGCAVDLLCDTAVLLSPVSRDTLLNVMPNYNPRPLLIAASTQDVNGVQTGEALRVAATGEAVFQPIAAAGSGAALIFNAPDLTGVIGTWLAQKLVE